MTIEEKKSEAITKILSLEDEKLLETVILLLNPAPSPKLREPGWGKGIFTYVSEDFDDFVPPGFNEDDEIFP